MEPGRRIVVNTAAQYVKTIVNVLLSLYSTRLVLEVVGVTDFGIYSIVAGVVAMLSFVSNALVVSTQRFLSFYKGRGDIGRLREIFNDSVLLHLIIGVVLAIILLALTPLLFNGYLEIPAERNAVARFVYAIVTAVIFVTFVTAPYRASLIAHEDIVYISVIDIMDGVLKVVLVIILSHMTVDKLGGYAIALLLIQLFNFFAMSVFSILSYEESGLPRFRRFSPGYVKELGSFAGWTIYSTGCVVGRTQGFAILLNRFLGVMANSAFGVAQQVHGFVGFISESLLNAIRPQIMKSEGEGNRARMLDLSCKASKYSTLLIAAAVVPIFFYMETLLEFWLRKDIPDGAAFFCRMVVLASLADACTIGLGTANQAIGNIRNYSLAVNTLKVLTVPLAWLCLKAGLSGFWLAFCYVGMELTCAIVRIPFLKATAGLDAAHYVRDVLCRLVIPIAVYAAFVYFTKIFLGLGFIVCSCIALVPYSILVLLFSLDRSESARLKMAFTRR